MQRLFLGLCSGECSLSTNCRAAWIGIPVSNQKALVSPTKKRILPFVFALRVGRHSLFALDDCATHSAFGICSNHLDSATGERHSDSASHLPRWLANCRSLLSSSRSPL